MKYLKYSALLLTAILIAGCAPETRGTESIVDQARVNEIVIGTSTRNQVLASVGEPLSRSSSGGLEYWTYQHTRIALNAATFIPVVQLAAGGGNTDIVTMIVTFGRDGVVQNVVRRCSRTTTHMLAGDRNESGDC